MTKKKKNVTAEEPRLEEEPFLEEEIIEEEDDENEDWEADEEEMGEEETPGPTAWKETIPPFTSPPLGSLDIPWTEIFDFVRFFYDHLQARQDRNYEEDRRMEEAEERRREADTDRLLMQCRVREEELKARISDLTRENDSLKRIIGDGLLSSLSKK